jgi:hypothetical protein
MAPSTERPSTDPTDPLVATRRSWHVVAEHVLAAARKRATGQISLRPGPGGVRTPPQPDGGVIAIDGTHLEVTDGEGTRRGPLTTVRAAAALAGTEPGFPWTKHPPGTVLRPDDELEVDEASARVLADWFALGDRALRELGAGIAPGAAPEPEIYPEHFDLAIALDEVNYGASPGDDAYPEPYLYVGPWAGPPAGEGGDPAYWNAPFGAARSLRDVPDVDAAVAFLLEGRRRLTT